MEGLTAWVHTKTVYRTAVTHSSTIMAFAPVLHHILSAIPLFQAVPLAAVVHTSASDSASG